MNRSVSARNIQSQSKSPSRRGIYINEQFNKKEKNTIFHSPYKDGKPNKDYINPSFLSSHIFYPKDCIQKSEKYVVKKNYALNQNDIKKENLYRERMKTQAQFRQKTREKEKQVQRNRQFRQTRNVPLSRILRLNQPEKILKRQLQSLKNYREAEQILANKNKNQERERQQDIPPYFEKEHRNFDHQIQVNSYKRTQMNDFMALSKEIEDIKRQMKKNSQILDSQKTNKTIQQVRANQWQHQRQIRKESQLLSTILKQQIKTNSIRRDQRRNN